MESNAAIAPEKVTEKPVATEEPTQSPHVSTDTESVDDFIHRMSTPRKENKGAFDTKATPDSQEDGSEPITDNDEENLENFNFSEDHRNTALFLIGLLDSAIGWIGTFSTGMEPERYQRFAKGSPPAFYVDATAAMVKKYHARLSLEVMFVSALAMVYGPSMGTIYKDRKILKEKAMEEKIRERSARMA